jgi:hypothetical protein
MIFGFLIGLALSTFGAILEMLKKRELHLSSSFSLIKFIDIKFTWQI